MLGIVGNAFNRKETIKHKVETLSLDSFLQDEVKRQVDFIKIDVEGHELEVLKGAVGILNTRDLGFWQKVMKA